MQSANVLIETVTTAGQRPAQNSENASGAGGSLFGHELKQQQQQIEEQRTSDSKFSSNAGDDVSNRRPDSSDTAANGDRSEDRAHHHCEDSDSRDKVADSDASAESGHDERGEEDDGRHGGDGEDEHHGRHGGDGEDEHHGRHGGDGEDEHHGRHGDDEEVSEVGLAMHNQLNPLQVVETPTNESSGATVTTGVDGLPLPLVSKNGADDESGNILPLTQQNGDVVAGEAGQRPVLENGDIGAVTPPAQKGGEKVAIEGEMLAANTDPGMEPDLAPGQERPAANGIKQQQEVVSTAPEVEGENRAAIATATEQTVVNQPMGGEVVPAAVVSAPANGPQNGQNDPLTPSGAATGVANATSNQSAGMGAGNSDNSNSMAGRQQPAHIGVAKSEGESEGVTDKTGTFLASLKSVAKAGANGANGVEMQAASPAGAKPQTSQVSQMISQLSSFQSVSQTQAAPVTTLAPTAMSAADSTPAMLTIATSMRQQGWDRAMGERLVFMARNGVQEAQIQVNPRQLGPIDIKVSVNQEQQAHVTFVTTTNAARETVDAAMPRLREMFDQAGLNLAESEVSQRDHQHSSKGESADDDGASNGVIANGAEDDQDESIAQQVGYIRPSGLDLFA